MKVGTKRTLALVSCASATQTLAWAAATINGRASLSRSAVARLIGNPTSVDSRGAFLSFTASGSGDAGTVGERCRFWLLRSTARSTAGIEAAVALVQSREIRFVAS